jgi:hypothetical protein
MGFMAAVFTAVVFIVVVFTAEDFTAAVSTMAVSMVPTATAASVAIKAVRWGTIITVAVATMVTTAVTEGGVAATMAAVTMMGAAMTELPRPGWRWGFSEAFSVVFQGTEDLRRYHQPQFMTGRPSSIASNGISRVMPRNEK